MVNDNIRIVLVATSHPGNIGGVARAMKNMAIKDLYLVAPMAKLPSVKAVARAAGAVDILDNLHIVDTLEEALADCHVVFGASARLRAIPWPLIDTRECAKIAVETIQENKIAVVFGRENSGLTNDELERCNYLVHIPANQEYTSLNIAQAVQVICYELFMAIRESTGETIQQNKDYALASNAELEGLYTHFSEALEEIGFYDPENPRQLMRRLRRLFNRAHLDTMEMNILRGILTAAVKPKIKKTK